MLCSDVEESSPFVPFDAVGPFYPNGERNARFSFHSRGWSTKRIYAQVV